MESESEGEGVCSIHVEYNECSGEFTVVYDREECGVLVIVIAMIVYVQSLRRTIYHSR